MKTGEGVWNPPTHATEAQIKAAQDFANAVLIARPPAEAQFLNDRLSSLLAHYFTSATGEKLNTIVASDWMVALKLFPSRVISSAAREWLEKHTGKPKIAEFKDLCITYYGRKDWHNFERAIIIGRMLPSAPPSTAAPAKAQEETWQKPDAAAKERVAITMHNGGFHNGKHDPNCPKCKELAP